MAGEYRPRLSVEISPEQQRKLQKHLDHGLQKKVFNIIVDDVIRMLDLHGRNFLAAVILHKLSYQDYTTLDLKVKAAGPEDGKHT